MNAATTASKASKKPAAKPMDAPKTDAKPKAEVKAAPLTKAQRDAAKPAAPIKLTLSLTATAAEVNKAINSISLRGKKLDIDMHSAACASLNHVTLHGDTTLLNRLVLAMPKAARRNALIVWAMKFGMVILNEDAKTKADRPLVYAKGNTADIVKAQAEPFYALKNVREGSTEWLYMDFISSVMKTLEARAKADGIEGQRAKAALDALKGVNEALTIPAMPTTPPPGVTERRVAVH